MLWCELTFLCPKLMTWNDACIHIYLHVSWIKVVRESNANAWDEIRATGKSKCHQQQCVVKHGEPVKTATLQNGHNQNGHTEWDHYQNGHTTLVKTATLHRKLSKWPHLMQRVMKMLSKWNFHGWMCHWVMYVRRSLMFGRHGNCWKLGSYTLGNRKSNHADIIVIIAFLVCCGL